jgi:flagellar secretion chaperone FliS
MTPMEMTYRKTAVGGASGFGLLIALYDTLAGDLRRAAEAERAGNIEQRCKEINHALLVVAHLEDAISRGPGGELARQLVAFYSSLRRKMIEAQAKRSPEILEQQMALVLDCRRIWQGFEVSATSTKPELPAWAQKPTYPGSLVINERRGSNWSA